MTPEQLGNLVQTTGLSTALLLGLLFSLYKVGKLIVTAVLVPVAQAHVDYLRASTENMKRLTELQQALSSKMDLVLLHK